MNHDNFHDNERPSVKIQKINIGSIFIRTIEISDVALTKLKDSFNNLELKEEDIRPKMITAMKGKFLGEADSDDQIICDYEIEVDGITVNKSFLFQIQTPNQEIEENRIAMDNGHFPMPYYVASLIDLY